MMSFTQGQRIEANCKVIWGSDSEYELDVESDDTDTYQGFVRKDFGDSIGPPLTMTILCPSSKAAWTELDRMLSYWAKETKRKCQ